MPQSFGHPWRLDGRVALVTGGSSGLGRHFVQTLHRAGARVAIAARDPEKLQHSAARIDANDDSVLCLPFDVRDQTATEQAIADLVAHWGRIDILINSAGTTVQAHALDVTEEQWDQVLDTNLKGPWLTSTAAARAMVRLGNGGSIINIASILGLRVGGQISPYNTSKAGLIHLTRSLAVELAEHNIRVNALAPGYVESEMTHDFIASRAGEACRKRIPSQRFGELEDLDGPLLLLASDASRHMTGSVIPVDGGHLQSPL
ncbi:MAG: SDR family oxidoreductase [Gammaproteobacteria bacterium]|nr:SDR family oxidoreductase [Gammaproteobacteria bacterium]